MSITREDLAAAAAVGVLQYRQIDPLLVFLLQRDVRARRVALAEQVRRPRAGAWLAYAAGLLALVSAALFVMLYASSVEGWAGFILVPAAALYVLAATRVAIWFRRRGYCARLRILAAVLMASVPLALLLLQQAPR